MSAPERAIAGVASASEGGPESGLIKRKLMCWYPMQERRTLSLEQKIRVIRERENGLSQRELARQYRCSKTQVHQILKNKDSLIQEWKLFGHCSDDDDDPVPPKRPATQCHEQTDRKPEPQTDDQQIPVVRSCPVDKITIKCEPQCDAGYASRDTFVFAETCLLFDLLPKRSHVSDRSGTSESKVMLMMCVNAEAAVPVNLALVCRADANPAFPQEALQEIGVDCFVSASGLVSADVRLAWLRTFDATMRREGRQTVLFVRDDPCWRDVPDLSNVTVSSDGPSPHLLRAFVRCLKIGYRKRLLKFLLARKATSLASTEDISLAEAIGWLATTWQEMPSCAMRQCFSEKFGLEDDGQQLAQDWLRDLQSLQDLFNIPAWDAIPANIYASADDSLPVCEHTPREEPDELPLSQVGPDADEVGNEPISSIREALKVVARLKDFARNVGNAQLFRSVLTTEEHLANMLLTEFP